MSEKYSTAEYLDNKTNRFQRGNPGRRPIALGGSPNKSTLLLKMIEDKAEDIIDKMVEQALSGDSRVQDILISKLLPDLKSVEVKGDAATMPSLTIINQPPEPGETTPQIERDDAREDSK